MAGGEGRFLSGAALNRVVQAYLDAIPDWGALRVTTTPGMDCTVHCFRSTPLQGLLVRLKDRALVRALSHQHDGLLRFLNAAGYRGRGRVEVRARARARDPATGSGRAHVRVHDLVVPLPVARAGPCWKQTSGNAGRAALEGCGVPSTFPGGEGAGEAVEGDAGEAGGAGDVEVQEVKTKAGVGVASAAEFLDQYFTEIVARAAEVGRWWLAFLWRLAGSKSRKGRACIDYLVVVEVPAARLRGALRVAQCAEVTDLVQETRDKVITEDALTGDVEMETGPQGDLILWPVKNYWIVEALRDELAEKNVTITEKDQELAEKNVTITEKDQELAEKNITITEKDQELAEKDELLAEKDEVIAELRRALDHREDSE